ncbi:MAG TPA: LysM peptidoglycan-binding domain-containing protein [Pyrinomonadaceae bacterium]|jgi:LysM repeat protein|nr:LysM peptidoglycan-binding domain-containing protein [Pyrinomonadaceae bacterium]
MATKKSAASKKKAAVKKAASKTAATPTRSRVREQQDYSAKAGDTLKSVAEKFQVPLKFLARANNISESATLNAGMAVRIPELKLDAFGQVKEGWVEIAPIWYQKGKTFGDDRIITPKLKGKTLKEG